MSTDDRDQRTQATDLGLAADETLPHDPERPTPSPGSTGPVIRSRRSSLDPIQLGRYAIVRPLGRGGMGTVYEANDPELGRRVAIKVLRDDRGDPRFTEALRREAQALAKLVHPNVVTVHDVGVADGQVFVVMQLVAGETIDRWLSARHADASAIVTAFRQAGRGLAAAHAAGLVHCDFKPSNVLVDGDGVAQVSDFGLARFGVELVAPGGEVTAHGGAPPSGTTTIAGTPAYMAPEQFAGVATAASDQFAFCVSLWEVLLGERPFDDVGLDDVERVASRPRRPPPKGVTVPTHVVHALERGISPRPEDRFSSMDALLAALAPARWRRRATIGTVAALGLAGASIAGFVVLHEPPKDPVAERPVEVLVAGEADLASTHALTHYKQTACAYSPTIDPSGDVVFDRTMGDAVDLYHVSISGGEPKQLTSAPGSWEWRAHAGRRPGEVIHLVHVAKGTSGDRIAFLDLATARETGGESLFAIDAVVAGDAIVYIARTGSELRRLQGTHDAALATAEAGGSFAMLAASPRKDRLAAISVSPGGERRLCLVEGTAAHPTCFPGRVTESRPAFAPDGRAIYFGAPDGLHRRDLHAGTDTLILPGARPSGGLAVAPDGRTLIYSECGTQSQIIDFSTSPPAVVVDDADRPIAAGTTIAWLRNVRGTRILMARTAGGHDVEITRPEFGAIKSPRLSPDGGSLAFVGREPHPGVFVVSLRPGDSPRRITEDPSDDEPTWIDDETLAFNRKRDDQSLPSIFTISSDGGIPRELGQGRMLRGARRHELLVTSVRALYWLDVETGIERAGPELLVDGNLVPYISLSSNGRWLQYHVGAEAQELFRRSLDPPGKPERVGAIAGGQSVGPGAITDAGHVLVAPRTWSGDLVEVVAREGARF